MEFSRIGKHTIRCVISEEEISDLGYTLDEIMSNGERTQEFMNQIFDLAEQQFETKFELGVKTVRADFMSDHTLSLTFSEHPGAEGMMEHLKDIVNSLLNAIPQQKWEEIQAARDGAQDEEVRVLVTLVFPDMDTLIRFARQAVSMEVPNALYKYRNAYYLIVDFSHMEEDEVRRLSSLTDEYAMDLLVGAERKAYIEEHGERIIESSAIETLRQL
ncbi:MAG: adaptor protein MecA [Muribaculaceae bacterium]|nr:adaptor protein MecA [Roseburia sp.]MCM1430575.1 adaptor protein MecA [Muribaculaceae bacterium]MCM1492682.1 adaptor protein MecA [Muribaculaceae bacterium]